MQCLPGILLIPKYTPQQYTGRKEGPEKSKQRGGKRESEDREEGLDEEWSAACRMKECLPGEREGETDRSRGEKRRAGLRYF